ncbi:uncharacterized protein [Panulirus ornatus]|uniref:uncharacterized protein n=1 Tax=Panulirus ornatus TaxID=150431 RepID=UPI003A84BECE
MSDGNYTSGLPTTNDTLFGMWLSSSDSTVQLRDTAGFHSTVQLRAVAGSHSTVQRSAVAGSHSATQLSDVAGSPHVTQLSAVGDSYPAIHFYSVDDPHSLAQLNSLTHPDQFIQLGSVAGPDPVIQLGSVAGPDPVIQLGSVAGPDPVIQLGSVASPDPVIQQGSVAGPDPVIQLGSVAGPDSVIQLGSVAGPDPVIELGSVAGPDPIMPLGSMDKVYSAGINCEALLDTSNINIHDMDIVTLVNVLGITPSEDDRSKLLEEPGTYMDLLPPVPEASHGQSVSVQNKIVDLEDMQCDQPQPVTLHREQGREFLEQLVSACQSDSIQASQTASPPSQDVTPDNTKKRRRQNNAATNPARARQPKRRKQKPVKKYELKETLEDPVEEKKRLNAINSKKNRDSKKQQLAELDERVKKVTAERNKLEVEVQQLREREEELRKAIGSSRWHLISPLASQLIDSPPTERRPDADFGSGGTLLTHH